jgi:PleD family two-component response regulator
MNSVLIVDKEIKNLELLASMLDSEYTVYRADSGAAAIEAAKEKRPDVILLDMQMPDMGGAEVIATLRGFEQSKDIPVIALLDLDGLEDDNEDFLCGAVDYIQKPLPSVVVKSRVRNYVHMAKQRQMLEQMEVVDKLTNVFCPKFFDARLKQEWNRAIRDGTNLSVLVLGIDDYESEDCLAGVAEIIKNNLKRSMDLAARWKNEVFVMLLPNTPAFGAVILAEIIRTNIENRGLSAVIAVNSVVPEKQNSPEDFFAVGMESFTELRKTNKNTVCSLN